MPKRGRVLIWPSVLDDDPNEKDARTDHQALPVEAGQKYGANAWLHMRDFKVSEKANFFCLDNISVTNQHDVSVQLKYNILFSLPFRFKNALERGCA